MVSIFDLNANTLTNLPLGGEKTQIVSVNKVSTRSQVLEQLKEPPGVIQERKKKKKKKTILPTQIQKFSFKHNHLSSIRGKYPVH